MKIQRSLSAARPSVALLCFCLAMAGCARQEGQQSFATPEAAFEGFVTALDKGDAGELAHLLGPDSEDVLSSGDPVQDEADQKRFLASYQVKHAVTGDGDTRTLEIGPNNWPFSIPVVKRDGRWYLDGAAGADELIYRRVGANELGAIAVCRGFVAAEYEYAAEGRDGDPAGIYALKLVSDEGLHNGLYWPSADGETPSPAGAFVAAAANEGYRAGKRTPYHGYYYRMLFRQGENASSGAHDYFADGLLTKGFALVAWPADYGVSGVMTFMVNQDGGVFQKDLGDDTDANVAAIDVFDPDSSWAAVTGG